MGYQRRLRNYRLFQRSLKVRLVTVELAFQNKFELEESDATRLVQLSTDHLMWQKERLLNLALERLPPDCTKVAWLDCDIIFESEEWPQVACEALYHHPIIQPFEYSYDLKKSEGEEIFAPSNSIFRCESLGKRLARNQLSEDFIKSPGLKAEGLITGYAWAARRDLLERHKLYDPFIIGGGDAAILGAIFGKFRDLIEIKKMNQRQVEHYLTWAEPFYREVAGNIGSVAGNVYHLWHGELANRNYKGRFDGLKQFSFDPFHDIAIDSNGCWRWNSQKPELHQYLKDYFASRSEDG